MKSVGIIDVFGPDTTAAFYLNIVDKFRMHQGVHYPDINIYTIPATFELEEHVVRWGKRGEEVQPLLVNAAQKLEQTGSHFIVMPCNTVHAFWGDVKNAVSVPVCNIMAETVNFIKPSGAKKVGLIATTKTVESGLYQRQLENEGIAVLAPPAEEQKEISRVISNILNGQRSENDKAVLLSAAHKMKLQGAEAIISGCTALPLVMNQEDIDVPLIDSLEVLADTTARELAREDILEPIKDRAQEEEGLARGHSRLRFLNKRIVPPRHRKKPNAHRNIPNQI